jgi:GH15 family glucan-1,4-alpha-glucosidase
MSAPRRDPLSLSTAHVLRDYALLADGERGIILGPGGDVAWMCFPRWDSPACFASMAGGRGTFAIAPRERYTWGGYYERGLIWRHRWSTSSGVVECRDALAFPGVSGRAVLLRRITVPQGVAPVRVVLDVHSQYGTQPARRWRLEDGIWSASIDGATVMLAGGAEAVLHPDGHRGHALWIDELSLAPGEHHDLVFVIDERRDPAPPPHAEAAWNTTETNWAEEMPDLRAARAERDALHAYAVLRGMTAAGGGMVAAATMSMPERAHQGRNYDYRYVWVRDQALVGQAAAQIGSCSLTDNAVMFVRELLLEHGDRLAPAYTISGDPVPDERELAIPGYPGGAAIIGNHVNAQFQLDTFGGRRPPRRRRLARSPPGHRRHPHTLA